MPELISLKSKLFASPPKNSKYYIVAIDGRGGAGKTTLSLYIKSLLPEFCFISGDDYFEPIDHPIAWGGFNEKRFTKDVIKPLQEKQTSITYHPYDWDRDPHIVDHQISITKGVVIERCYSFAFDLNYDLKIWVETATDITLRRGISRSTMPEIHAEKVWRELWTPLEDRYIAETKPTKTSDIVISGTKPYHLQLSA